VCYLCDGTTEGEETFIGLTQLQNEGRLNHYYEGARHIKNIGELEDGIIDIINWQAKYGSSHISIKTLKVFLDGTNEIGNSALIEPYACDPEGRFCGDLQFSEEEMGKVFTRANEEGLDVHVHMVGDRAFRAALNALEKSKKAAQQGNCMWATRTMFLHCELTDPSDWDRAAAAGVYVNWSPHWSGGIFGDASKKFLGEERFDRLYSFNGMIRAGVAVNFSSDIVDMEEEERADPFLGIQIGHTRYDASLGTGKIRGPESEKLSIHDLLMGYTIYNAKALGCEKDFGSLETGKTSNLIVLNQNLFEVEEGEISRTKPLYFLFDGRELVNKMEINHEVST
jgi:predicted amidohydrolase YtcJ